MPPGQGDNFGGNAKEQPIPMFFLNTEYKQLPFIKDTFLRPGKFMRQKSDRLVDGIIFIVILGLFSLKLIENEVKSGFVCLVKEGGQVIYDLSVNPFS